MDIISSIILKPNWNNKINNTTITNKWKQELLLQNENEIIIDFAIKYLKNISTNYLNKFYEDDDEYTWICDVSSNPKEVCHGNFECNCECYHCGEYGYYDNKPTLEEFLKFQELDKEDVEDIKIFEKTLNIPCTCEIYKNLLNSKLNYLNKFIKIIDKNINKVEHNKLIKAINKLQKDQKNTIGVDFQPNTHNTTINIVHPALTCYVNGISKITNNEKNILEPSMLQWLPLNYSTITKKFTSKLKNVDDVKHENIYSSLEFIFTSFLPHFQEVLNSLFENGKISSSKNLMSYKQLQVIPKIANTFLTPENSQSNGTSWHLEGIKEENIIATGIYYINIDNITQSKLKFRTTISSSTDIDYPQGCSAYVKSHYGFDENFNKTKFSGNTETTMELGSINTNKYMSIVFPNCFQHKVENFELFDKTKNGNRSILVFFLIDPDRRVLSTNDVDNSEISLQNAKKFREILMFDRKFKIGDQENFFERGFSLCEH